MKSLTIAIFKLLPAIFFAANASSAQFLEDFSGSLPSPSWSTNIPPGYSIQFAGGRGAFEKVGPTTPNTAAYLTTNFVLDGDFEVSVDLDARSGGSLYDGLTMQWRDSTTFAQIYLIGNRIFQGAGPSPSSYTFNNSTTTIFELKFKITRIGTTMSLSFDRGQGGFETFYTTSGAIYSGPVLARLEVNETGSSALSTSYFDNFLAQATTITPVPEPTSVALLLAGLFFITQRAQRHVRFLA